MLEVEKAKELTQEYYSCFCGINLTELETGNYFVALPKRDEVLKGYGSKYTIYILEKEDSLVISYSPKYEIFVEELKSYKKEEIINRISQRFPLKKMQLMIFDKEIVTDYGQAKILDKTDYEMYKQFFCEMFPGIEIEGWLYDYFKDKVKREHFAGYVLNGRLVSVCDAPDMPYMEGMIQHTGISTLYTEQKKGYAKLTSALATHRLLEQEICPQWDCDADNIASIELAKSIGYVAYGKAYFFEEWE